ncbi:thiol protease SEN102-like protein, partial [Trifolium pratense]
MSHIFTLRNHGGRRTLFMPQKRMFSIRASFHDIDMENLNAKVDHRRSGCMTAIDDQAPCRSCWAIATVSAARKLKTRILEKLSAKELIDCVEGCDTAARE